MTDVDPDYVRLDVTAADGRFAGSVEVYGGLGLVTDIADRLDGFPSSPTDRREILIGSLDPRVAGGWVKLLCVCVDRAGHPVIEVEMRSKYEAHGLAAQAAQAAVVRLRVEAPAIDEFVQSLRQWDGALGTSVALRGAT
ncbi:MAG: hypothetical protein ABIQ10_06090 [Gemmatimonadaceae bacterium]